jgi:CRP-like cAMP-binding protein
MTVECEISWVPHAELKRVTERSPHLTRLLWMSSVVDGAITRRALSVVGRLSPAAKLAHLACEIYIRLKAVGCADSYRFDLPITQVDLSDIFGLSTVHLNRSLQTLRATGALTWEGGVVTIKDWDRLAEIGSFEADYLDLVRSSR